MTSNLLFNLSSKASVQFLMYTQVLSKLARTLSARSSAYTGRVTSFAFEAEPPKFSAMIKPDIFRENSSRIQQGKKIQQNFHVSAATLAMEQTTSVFSRQQSNAAWEQPPQLQN
jgi:hypothetical protein